MIISIPVRRTVSKCSGTSTDVDVPTPEFVSSTSPTTYRSGSPGFIVTNPGTSTFITRVFVSASQLTTSPVFIPPSEIFSPA